MPLNNKLILIVTFCFYCVEDSSEDVPIAEEEVAEEMFPGGFVRGLYTYMDTDGMPATVEYEAAPETGFVIKSYYKETNEKLPGTESVKLSTEFIGETPNEQSIQTGKGVTKRIIITPLSSSEGSVKYTPEIDLPVNKYDKSNENAESMTFEDSTFKREDENFNTNLMLPRSSIKNFQSPKTNNNDDDDTEEENDEDSINSSYRFGFAVDNQSRQEESDSNGNVKGSYSYLGTDGFLTKVEYEAGANKGFVVKKMTHDPTNTKNSDFKPVREKISLLNSALDEDKTNKEATSKDGKIKSDSSLPNEDLTSSEDSNVPSESRKSVSFASLEGVPQTNLERSYSFSNLLARGNIFQGQYKDPNQSQCKNEFSMYGLPLAQRVSTDQVAIREMAERAKHHHSKDKRPHGNRPPVAYKPNRKKPKTPSFTRIKPDGSYAFAYKTNDSSRRESIDANGNIHYSYQFKNKRDGNTVVIFNNKVSKIARTKESDAQDVSPNHEILQESPAHPQGHLLTYPVPNPTVYQPMVNHNLPDEKLHYNDMVRQSVRRIYQRAVSRKINEEKRKEES